MGEFDFLFCLGVLMLCTYFHLYLGSDGDFVNGSECIKIYDGVNINQIDEVELVIVIILKFNARKV